MIKTKDIKVLHIIWGLGIGGAEKYLHDVVRQQLGTCELCPEVLVLSHRGPWSRKIERLGIRTQYLGMRHGYDVSKLLLLHEYLFKGDHDIIHSHAVNFAFNWTGKNTRVPMVYTEHGGGLLGGLLAGAWKRKLWYRLFGRNYRKLIAISKEMAKVMEKANPNVSDRIRIVYNGINIEEIDTTLSADDCVLPNEILKSQFRVGIIGRLVPKKGIETFLETAAILARNHDDIVFPIVGDGILRQALEARAEKLNIKNRIFFLGNRQDAIRILKSFSVFLFTSNFEPFGLVLAEAMAAQIPVVAFAGKGAVREIVEDGINGFVINTKDPKLLADRVRKVLFNSTLRNQLTRNARKKVEENFSIEQNAIKVLQVYQECL